MTVEEESVAVEELSVVRAPGFETNGFAVDALSPGINLIHGPNATGKTTTAESLQKVLWPDFATDGEHLVGHLSLNGDDWRVDVNRGVVEYQRNGQDTSSPPSLPPAEHRDRYRLSLHELLQKDTRNEQFAELIERESAGGFDLAAAKDELGYGKSPITRRKGVYQAAEDAVQTWRDEQQETRELEEDRSRLTKLKQDLEEAKDARQRKQLLEQAIKYRKRKSELEEARAELETFPDVLSQIDGDEIDRVEELDDKIDKWEKKKDDAETTKQQAQSTLDDVEMPGDGVPTGTIAELEQRRDDLKECESQERESEAELEEAETERDQALDEIPLDVEHEDIIDLEPGTWSDVSEFARAAHEVQVETKFQRKVEQWAETDNAPANDLQTLERGSKALEEWLLTAPPAADTGDGGAALRIGAVSALVVSLAGVVLGVLVDPLLFGVILVGLGLGAYGYLQAQGTDGATSDRRISHRESFEKTGLETPTPWTEEDVRARLTDLYDEIASHHTFSEREQHRSAILDEDELVEKKQRLAEEREELKSKLGAAPDTTDIELVVIVRRILDWQAAHDEVVGLEKRLDEIEKQQAKYKKKLRTELAEYGYDEIKDAADARAKITDLKERQSIYEQASRKLEDAKKAISKAEQKCDEFEEERDGIFADLGLEPGEYEELRDLCEQVSDYEAANDGVTEAAAVEEEERKQLEQNSGYNPELAEMELPELREEHQGVEETAAEIEEVQREIADIEAEIKQAKQDTSVEDAIREKNNALDELKAQLMQDWSSMVGDALVDHVQEVTVEASRPAVFQRANELLATITHGQYELKLEESEQTFRAYDTAKQKGLALNELSGGTRLQVLLAVRLAFVEQQEQGRKLPIVLDETLANTDDLRAEVIIESLIELARNGRQVFYFTAQGDEVAKWKAALEDADVEQTIIDLADERELDNSVEIPDFDEFDISQPALPDPDNHDYISYGKKLDLEFDPYNGPETAHLWYIVDDVEVLHDLLEHRIETWGQLKNILDKGKEEGLPIEDKKIKRVQQNGEALGVFTQAWSVGRGEPIDRNVLENSGAISSTFIDRVTELANELNWDGEQLVKALYDGEVDRFRTNKAEELENYLRENDYISPVESLNEDEIISRMEKRLIEMGLSSEEAIERVELLLDRLSHT
ncbi:MAG: AAA family ATPase [Halobacteriales archaeon]|nr:AAA family ATPase [Halobacteriales archaeon]